MENAYRDKPRKPEIRAMLFAGVLYGKEEQYTKAKGLLESEFGPIMTETPPVSWDHSDYYKKELGPEIKRRFLFFSSLIRQDGLKEAKLKTLEMERKLMEGERRTVNIDPGYLTAAKVALASTKDYSHRICLGEGIFAEITLHYKHGRFRPHIFTYNEYSDGPNLAMFEEAREKFKSMLKG